MNESYTESETIMTERGFSTTITVAATPDQAFAAINDVRAWWSHDIDGTADAVDAQFTFFGKDVHRSQIRVDELVAGQRVVWHVVDNYLSFVADHSEWTDTRIVFEISPAAGGTQICFSHVGLVPAYECYDACSNAWAFFIEGSLRSLITTGQGMPMRSERSA
jgi:hypothetical protein